MKIIVDTNIIFSALLNSNSRIGEILLNPNSSIQFYSCSYMRSEIKNHWQKLKTISKLSDNQLQTSFLQIVSRISFIEESLIPTAIWNYAESLAKPIDIDDVDFIALSIFLEAPIWTGDKQLYRGLKEGGFYSVLNLDDLNEL